MRLSNNNTLMINENVFISALNDASYLYAEYVCREMEKVGMRYSYRHVLKPLIENDSLTQLELVNITKLKAPTISITLRNMEREGIVSRRKSDNDRRETHVAITEKGRKMYKKVLDVLAKAEKLTLKGLDEDELSTLLDIMDKVCSNLSGALR